MSILIISRSQFDETTNEVCHWLNHYESSYIRLNVDELNDPNKYRVLADILNEKLEIIDIKLNKEIELKNVSVVWCRRYMDLTFENMTKYGSSLDSNTVKLSRFLAFEKNKFLKIIFDFYKHWDWIDHYSHIESVNKIKILKIANDIGLKVPNTIISNNLDFLKQAEDHFITKPIYEGTSFIGEELSYMMHTQPVNKKQRNKKKFISSLFQNNIEKKYEIRVFYLDGKCFSMAIFSKQNKKTQNDYRNYDFNTPNRMVPINIPKWIEEKIGLV